MAGARAEAGELSASFLECDLRPDQSSPPAPTLFVFLKEFRISCPINCSLQKDNNQDKVMLISQPVPHTVQVTICWYYGGLSELSEGLGLGDGKAPTKLIFVRKDVWASLAKWQKHTETWRKTESNSEVKLRPQEKPEQLRFSTGIAFMRADHRSSKAYFICFGLLLQKGLSALSTAAAINKARVSRIWQNKNPQKAVPTV